MKIEFKSFLAVFFLRFFAALPRPVLRATAKLAAWFLWVSNSKSRRITEVNLNFCYAEKTAAERQILAQQSLLETARTALEMPAFMLKPIATRSPQVSNVRNEHLLHNAMAKGKGVIMIAPHIGNWEFLGHELARHYPLRNLYQPVKIPAINAIIKNGRTATGSKLEPTNKKGVMGLLKGLKNGECIGILPDQIPDAENGTMYAPFFGQSTATMTLVSSFLKRTEATALGGMAKRLDDGTFEVIYLEVDSGLYDEDLETSVAALNSTVEMLIAQAPAQYQWEYKRFKKGPDGRRAIY
ncbi:MAG: lysophospholipid acyltransferase family protein [Pseudomonadales bacterium]|nr:lysophospholipid acyltransferase family protein [Pseudomonadales bacterium]